MFKGERRHLTKIGIAVVAMFLQQTCGSVGRVLPAVLAPLILFELHADPACRGWRLAWPEALC
jgi:hypothetical protein